MITLFIGDTVITVDHTLKDGWCHCIGTRVFGNVKVHQQLLDFPSVDLEMVQLVPVDKVLGQFSVLPAVPVSDEANNCWVI